MISLISTLLLAAVVNAQYDANIVGSWVTKSKSVVTGPGFYNPVADELIEPALTGISYSFTIDGFYEEAYYRAISNPTQPACPSGIMQWQHGTYYLPGNGSIVLTPFGVDGRQLLSSPCSYDESVYTRYEQSEYFSSYQYIAQDPFHGVPRLNLFRFDGSPMIPMFLAYNPPQMLPTQTLNPTTAASTSTATSTAATKEKRGFEDKRSSSMPAQQKKMGMQSIKNIIQAPAADLLNADRWWWVGVGLTALGTVMYMMPTSG